jgi:hypothetical protein
MHNLVQGIIGAHEARTAGIAGLYEEVGEYRQAAQSQLGELDRTHSAMARQLRTGLARGRAKLKVRVDAQLHDVGQGHAALTRAEARRKGKVTNWLKMVDRAHQTLARHLQADQARERAALTPREAGRMAEVHAWMGQVATEHDGARQEWRRLAQSGAKR